MGICDGRVVIVTGAGRGIGRGHALEFARQGAKVVVNDLGAEADGTGGSTGPAGEVVDAIRAAGGEAVANGDDVADWEGAQRLVPTAVDSFGRLDVLVNNAGFLRDRMIVSTSEEEWDAVIRVHLKGHFAPTRFAAAYWREQQKAGSRSTRRVINTSSGAGLMGSVGQGTYSAAKAGIAALTMVESAELGRYGVTANAIAPAARTRMTEAVFADTMAQPEGDAFDAMAPENVAPLVVWLGSAESKGITGRVFEVEGGILSVADGWQHGTTGRQGRALGSGRARTDRARAARRRARAGTRLRRLTSLHGSDPRPSTRRRRSTTPAVHSDVEGVVVVRSRSHGRHAGALGVAAHARLRPDKVAIVAGDRRLTYGELDAAVTGAAHTLRARGVGPDAPARHRAAQPAGVVDRGARRGPARRPGRPDPVRRDRRRARRTSARTVRSRSCSTKPGSTSSSPTSRPRRRSPSRTRAPTTSSCARTRRGRPGVPRRCSARSGSAEAAMLGMVRYYESYGIAGPDEVNLTASPLHHLAGFSGPHSALIVGHTSVLLDHFDAADAVDAIESERVTYWICAPVHLYRLTRLPQERPRPGRPLEHAAGDARLRPVRAEPEARGDGAVPSRARSGRRTAGPRRWAR